jgi:hypothetical protein
MAGAIGHSTDGEPLIQRCDVAAPMMAAVFPELKIVVGSYKSDFTHNSLMYHVWCETLHGDIVDPTGRQFDAFEGPIDSYKRGTYIPDET